MTDPISDMLTRIRNGLLAKKKSVWVPWSNHKMRLAEILQKEGYVSAVLKEERDRPVIRIDLRYFNNSAAIHLIRRISKPSRRVYVSHDRIPISFSGKGMLILSTSRGLFSDREAKKMKLGGECLCEIY